MPAALTGGIAWMMKNKKDRVLLFGLGDLGSRIAQIVAERGLAAELKLASRGESAGKLAQRLRQGTRCEVSAKKIDGLDLAGVTKVLAEFEPGLIIQSASLLSPWALLECGTPPALGVVAAGFALQVSAQLPVVTTVMRARKELGLPCAVLNCSFPDLTNPMLARVALAPTAGIGNVAMIAHYLGEAGQRKRGRLRVIAHHAHVRPVLTGKDSLADLPLPLVYENGRRLGKEEIFLQPRLTPGREFNDLTAVTAIPLITGLLDTGLTVETHAPGVLGLPGGYSVRIEGGTIGLDLPGGITGDEAVEFNNSCARADGIERIETDGTLIYTEQAKRLAAPWCTELAEPFAPGNAEARFWVLQAFYRSCRPSQARIV
jgi:hypothetical protein